MAVNVAVETIHPNGTRDMKVIDHDDHASRVWLGRHCFWAMRNGRTVLTGPTSAPVSYVPKEEIAA